MSFLSRLWRTGLASTADYVPFSERFGFRPRGSDTVRFRRYEPFDVACTTQLEISDTISGYTATAVITDEAADSANFNILGEWRKLYGQHMAELRANVESVTYNTAVQSTNRLTGQSLGELVNGEIGTWNNFTIYETPEPPAPPIVDEDEEPDINFTAIEEDYRMTIYEEFRQRMMECGLPVGELCEEHVEEFVDNKHRVTNLLGLNPDTLRLKVKVDLPENSRDHLGPQLRHWIEQLENENGFTLTTTPRALITDSQGVEHKATRFLKNLVGDGDSAISQWVLQETGSRSKEGVYRASIFWSKLGEILGSPFIDMYLSANPSDILTCSHDGGFSSCLRPGGEYFASVASYLRDDFTFLCYVGTPTKKTGRAFVYLGQSGLDFIFSRSYGSFTDHHRKLGRQVIERSIARTMGLHNHWIKRSAGLCSQSYAYGVYFDGGESDYLRHDSERHSHPQAATPPFKRVACIFCDETGISTSAILCPDCSYHTNSDGICCGCDGHVGQNDIYRDQHGRTHCESCYYESYTSCGCCGDEVSTDNAYYTDWDSYCEACFYESYFHCAHCGETTSNDDARSVSGDSWCPHCIENQGLVGCEECYDYTDDYIYTESGHTYCSDCQGDHVTECDICHEYKENDTITTIAEDGREVCQACLEDNFSGCNECAVLCDTDDLNEDGVCEDCAEPEEEAI